MKIDKQIVLKIGIDTVKDEFVTLINTKGFDSTKEIQNIHEIIGWLQRVQYEELKKADSLTKTD